MRSCSLRYAEAAGMLAAQQDHSCLLVRDDIGGSPLPVCEGSVDGGLCQSALGVFGRLLLVDVDGFRFLVYQIVQMCCSTVRKVSAGLQGQCKFVIGKKAELISYGFEGIAGGETYFLKNAGVQERSLKFAS